METRGLLSLWRMCISRYVCGEEVVAAHALPTSLIIIIDDRGMENMPGAALP